MQKKVTEEKKLGKYYTPIRVVKDIMDEINYVIGTDNIRKKHIMDNSCGNGSFLMEIVNRYCEECILNNVPILDMKRELETYIHGIEINSEELDKCIDNLNNIVFKYGLNSLNWDLLNKDALFVNEYNGSMDYVVGNPPYVKIHNMQKHSRDVIKVFNYVKTGTADAYLIFFEIGLKMLSNNGLLAYLTPSSYFNSKTGYVVRSDFVGNNYLFKIIDYKHNQLFDATTYVAVSILLKGNNRKNIDYLIYDKYQKKYVYIDSLSADEYFLTDKFFFSDKNTLHNLSEILTTDIQCSEQFNIKVRYGLTTLADSVFISEKFNFESNYIKRAIKGSIGLDKEIIFPYDKNGVCIEEDILKKDELLYKYLLNNKYHLYNRDIRENSKWYSFGRTQAIKDTYFDKVAVSMLIKDVHDLKITFSPAGTAVYSCVYVILNDFVTLDFLEQVLRTEKFVDYVASLGKYKNGGYYSFSASDLELYIKYCILHGFAELL